MAWSWQHFDSATLGISQRVQPAGSSMTKPSHALPAGAAGLGWRTTTTSASSVARKRLQHSSWQAVCWSCPAAAGHRPLVSLAHSAPCLTPHKAPLSTRLSMNSIQGLTAALAAATTAAPCSRTRLQAGRRELAAWLLKGGNSLVLEAGRVSRLQSLTAAWSTAPSRALVAAGGHRQRPWSSL
jgi:hypothetical protein